MTDATDSLVEQVLVLRCQSGDSAAFVELVGRYDRRLRYYLLKMLAAPDRVDDAMQELWVDVLRSIGRLKEPRAFAAWLYRLARDRAYREMRTSSAVRVLENSAERETGASDDSFGPEDAEEIHHALGLLQCQHREVLLLRFVEDMSYEQIAVVVGCDIGTVRSRLHYAKRELRELLEMRNRHDERKRSWGRAAATRG